MLAEIDISMHEPLLNDAEQQETKIEIKETKQLDQLPSALLRKSFSFLQNTDLLPVAALNRNLLTEIKGYAVAFEHTKKQQARVLIDKICNEMTSAISLGSFFLGIFGAIGGGAAAADNPDTLAVPLGYTLFGISMTAAVVISGGQMLSEGKLLKCLENKLKQRLINRFTEGPHISLGIYYFLFSKKKATEIRPS